jgi:glycosyltransferase involved in cell wall biosynthesis
MLLPRSVHIFDPELKGPGGHNLTQDLLISDECGKRGVPVHIYAHASANIASANVVMHKIFRFDLFVEHPSPRNEFTAFENYFLVNRAFFLDLLSQPYLNFSKDDLLYFPGITQNQIEALSDWLSTIAEESRPCVAVTLRWLNSKMLYNEDRRLSSGIEFLYRHSLIRLMERHPSTRLFSDTNQLAKAYSDISSLPVGILPVPQAGAPQSTCYSSGTLKEHTNVLYIGNLSGYRGAHLLPQIVTSIIGIFPNVNFTIQAQQHSESNLVRDLITLRDAYPSRVDLMLGTLSPEQYHTTMADADIVILPYMPAFYSWASSGVFVEASAMGKVTVVTAGTTLNSNAQEFGLACVTAEDWTAESFAAALVRAIDNLEVLKNTARISCERFSAENSAATFVDRLFSSFSK